MEDRLLIAVEQTQSNLLELNNQLSKKTTLVNDAKTELDKTLKGLQERNRFVSEHHNGLKKKRKKDA